LPLVLDTKHMPTNSQVHADSSNFTGGVTKEEAYRQVYEAAKGLFDNQRNWVRLIENQTPTSIIPLTLTRFG